MKSLVDKVIREKNVVGAYEVKADILDRAKSLSASAKSEERDLSDAEWKEVNRLLDVELPRLKAFIKLEEEEMRNLGIEPTVQQAAPLILADKPLDNQDDQGGVVQVRSETQTSSSQWVNSESGKPVRIRSLRQGWQRTVSELSPERYFTAKMTGDWSRARPEMQAAQKEGDNSLGGTLVPNLISEMLVDLAIEKSVMAQLGMTIVDMESETLRIARVSGHPTITIVGENQTIPESEITFDSILLVARKSAVITPVSLEVESDASNFGQLMVDELTTAMASYMDSQMLIGVGGGTEFTGLVENDNINETGSIGAISNDDVHDAAVAVMSRNETPTGYVAAAEIIGDLAKEKTSGSGEYLGPSPLVAPLMRKDTEHLSTANLILGDFSKCVAGMRHGINIATSEDGKYFEKHQKAFKVYVRWDFGLLRESAFQRLAGITT